MYEDQKFKMFLKSFQRLKERKESGEEFNRVAWFNFKAIEALINNPDDAEAQKQIVDNFGSGQQGGRSISPSDLLKQAQEKDSNEQESVALLEEALDYLGDDRPAFISFLKKTKEAQENSQSFGNQGAGGAEADASDDSDSGRPGGPGGR